MVVQMLNLVRPVNGVSIYALNQAVLSRVNFKPKSDSPLKPDKAFSRFRNPNCVPKLAISFCRDFSALKFSQAPVVLPLASDHLGGMTASV